MFSILPTVTGQFEVIENATGNTVDCRESARAANGVAQRLNLIEQHGDSRSMQIAMGGAPSRARVRA